MVIYHNAVIGIIKVHTHIGFFVSSDMSRHSIIVGKHVLASAWQLLLACTVPRVGPVQRRRKHAQAPDTHHLVAS